MSLDLRTGLALCRPAQEGLGTRWGKAPQGLTEESNLYEYQNAWHVFALFLCFQSAHV